MTNNNIKIDINFNNTNYDINPILPTKAHPSDIGYDLTVIGIKKKIDEHNIYLYDTGLTVIPPEGYYIEIVPRSSIINTGWILANSIGIVDPHYTGSLLIALMKISPNAKELEIPFTKCQMIIRPIVNSYINLISTKDVPITDRNSGGFGSSDKK